ncbi:MAG: hypothetical protein JTT11_00535 [Candidatus Brockarchaeota archaeon]|nr:hypothetical protein [Candidatus Brockarchaeota archaeon]
MASIKDANEILKVVKNPNLLLNWNWEWGPYHLDVAARWLPRKGFKILPKIFDANYRPGTVGDEGDKLIVKVHGCTIRSEDGWEPMPVWHDQVLQIPETREELKRIVEGNVLDMGFEDEVVREMERVHGKGGVCYKADKESLDEDNYTLKMLGEILTMLADCVDQVTRNKGLPPSFEFFIHE